MTDNKLMKTFSIFCSALLLAVGLISSANSGPGECISSNLPMKDPDAGIRDCSDKIDHDPKGGSFYHYMVRGLIYRDDRQYGKAIEDFTEAVKRDRTFGAGYIQRAITYDLMNKRQSATEDVKRYIAYVDKGRKNDISYLDRIKSQIVVENNGEQVLISGSVRLGIAEEFRKRLDKFPSVKTIRLQSPGGRAGVADEIIRIIKEKKLNTYVTHSCLSVCTSIFAAGSKRFLHPNAKLGFHMSTLSFVSQDLNIRYNSKRSLTDIKNSLEAIAELGVSDEFFEKLISTPNHSMWYPKQDILFKENIATDIMDESYKEVILPPALSDHYIAAIEKLMQNNRNELALQITKDLITFDSLNLIALDYGMKLSFSKKSDASFSSAFKILNEYSLTHRNLFKSILSRPLSTE